jgi:predicted DNA-binding antitoxin AbrB/MazE fold protein
VAVSIADKDGNDPKPLASDEKIDLIEGEKRTIKVSVKKIEDEDINLTNLGMTTKQIYQLLRSKVNSLFVREV